MNKPKGILQKLSFVSGTISMMLAITTGVALYLRLETETANNPISASLMASVFFFVCVGCLLIIIGRADLPSFKFDKPDS